MMVIAQNVLHGMKMSKNVTRMKIVVVPVMVMIPIQMLIWDYKKKGEFPFFDR